MSDTTTELPPITNNTIIDPEDPEFIDDIGYIQHVPQLSDSKSIIDQIIERDGKTEYPNNDEDIILVLGITGSGVSTVAKFLGGDNKNLVAKRKNRISYDIVIADNNKKESDDMHTEYPIRIVNEENKMIFYDCPGFSNDRNDGIDISRSYLINKVANSANSLKFIFVIDYPQIKQFNKLNDFKILVERAVEFINDIDKYKDSIVLFVNMVNEYNPGVAPSYITKFLKYQRDQQSRKVLGNNDIEGKILKFYEALLSGSGIMGKFGFMFKPKEYGKLSSIKLMQANKKGMLKILNDRAKYTVRNDGDFNIYADDSNLKYITGDVIKDVYELIGNEVKKIGDEIIEHYRNLENDSSDINELYKKFEVAFNSWDSILPQLKKSIDKDELIEQLNDFTKNFDISISNKYLSNIYIYEEYLHFIEKVVKRPNNDSSNWVNNFGDDVMTYFKYAKLWYEFLDNLQDILSDYNIQKEYKSYTDIVDQIKIEIGNTNKDIRESIKPLVREFLQHINKEDLYYEIPIFNNINYLDQTKLKHLSKVLDFAFNHKSTSSISNDKLIIKGRYVILSDFINDIKSNKIKHIEILALDRLYIDTGFDKTGQKAQVSIIAPTWDIIYNAKIILNGKNAIPLDVKKARNGMGPGADGSDGIPGYPGFPGGNFIGIAQNIINNDRLTVQTIGGKGGAGQDGGDGARGKDGRTPDLPDDVGLADDPPKAWSKYGLRYECKDVGTSCHYGDCWAYGSAGTRGGEGGHGGRGGFGGKPGNVIAISFNDDAVFNIYVNQGGDGINGTAGSGGLPGENGKDMHYRPNRDWFGWMIGTLHDSNLGTHTISMRGENGKITKGIKDPEGPDYFYTYEIINDFKSYLRENIKGYGRLSTLNNFLHSLETDKMATDLYNTLGYVNDLKSLENQFYKLEKEISLLPFYKTLLEKLSKYAESPNENERSTQYKKVLGFLYTSILSKIISIKNNSNNDLVIDVQSYLNIVDLDIKELNDYKLAVEKNKVKTKYHQDIDQRIKEARDLVEKDIDPELTHIMDQTYGQINQLIKDIIDKENTAIEERKELAKKKKELEDTMVLRGLLGVLSIASQALVFLGPIGAGAGAVIGGALQIGSQFAIDDRSGEGIDKISSLPSGVSKGISKLSDTFKEKQKIVKEELNNVAIEIEKYQKEEPSRGLDELQGLVTKAKKDLLSEVEKGDAFNQDSIDRIVKKRGELEKLLKEKEKRLKREKEIIDVKTEKQLKVIGHIQTIVSMGESTAQLVNSLRNDKAKMDKISQSIEKVNKKLEDLHKYEDSIYQVMVPMCRNMEDSVSKMGKQMDGKTHTALDVGKWKIQSTLKDIQVQIKSMTKGFSVNENITRCIEKFEYGMTTMIQLYDRIQDYQDKSALADYISDITSNTADNIIIDDINLKTSIDELKEIIHSNLVLKEYTKGITAIKQHVFPFAKSYLENYELPSYLRLENSTTNLLTFAKNKIGQIKTKLEKEGTLINQDRDSNIFSDVVFSHSYHKNKPFLVWKYETIKNTLNKLFDGKEVTIKSDISEGVAKNSIKFKEIGVLFKTDDKHLQKQLNKALETFLIEMKHLGTSYYRCGSRVYHMSHDNQLIEHSVNKNSKGHYDNPNNVYGKIVKNYPLLSPYTTWKLKFKKQFDENDFTELAKFKNIKIDIELEGRGLYVEHTIDGDVCDENLDKYYESDDVILENNNIEHNIFFQEHVEDIEPDNLFYTPTQNSTQNSSIDHRIKRRQLYTKNIIKKRAIDNVNNQYTTNGSNSNMKNSIINNIFGNIIYGLTVINYLNPFKSINDWFKNDIGTSIPSYINDDTLNDIKLNINTPLDEYTETSNNLIIGDNNKPYSEIFTPVNYDLLITNGNLLLLDLLIRKNNGMNYESNYVVNDNIKHNNNYAHDIAYNAHVPK